MIDIIKLFSENLKLICATVIGVSTLLLAGDFNGIATIEQVVMYIGWLLLTMVAGIALMKWHEYEEYSNELEEERYQQYYYEPRGIIIDVHAEKSFKDINPYARKGIKKEA